MRRLGYVSIFCWIMVIVICICFMFGFFNIGTWRTGFGSFHWTFDFDGDYEGFSPISEDVILNDFINDIEVKWVNGTIKVVPHDSDYYEIVTTITNSMKENQKAQYRLRDGNLEVIFCKPKANINVDKIKKDLTIYVPKGSVFDDISINSVSSRMEISDIEALAMTVEGVSGNVNIQGVSANDFEANNVSGRYTIRNSHFVNADIESVSGDLDFEGSLNRLEVDAVSGNYKIYSSTALESLDINGVSADVSLHIPDNSGFSVECNFTNRVNSSDFTFTVKDDNRLIYGDGSRSYHLGTVGGNMGIYKITP